MLETTYASSLVKSKTPQQEANHTGQVLQKKEAALRRAADAQVAAEAALAKATDDVLTATEECHTAKLAHDKVVAELSKSLGHRQATPDGYTQDGKKILLAVDEADFCENLDDYDETQQHTLRDLKVQIDNHCKQVAELQETLQVTLKSIKEIRSQPNKRLRGQDGQGHVGPGSQEAAKAEPVAAPEPEAAAPADAAAAAAHRESSKALAAAAIQEAKQRAKSKVAAAAKDWPPMPAPATPGRPAGSSAPAGSRGSGS